MNIFKWRSKIFFRVAAAIIIAVVLHWTGALAPIESLAGRIFSPLLSRFHTLGQKFNQAAERRASQEELISRNEELQKQINDLVVANAKLSDSEQENKQLREYLKFFNEKRYEYHLASIISNENFLDAARYDQNIIIDKGIRDGIEVGQAVVNNQGMVLGKILETKDSFSRACLLTNSACKLAVAIQNENRAIGVTEGELGLSVKINFVSQNEKINIGDIIVTSGLEQGVPAGLVLGKVGRVNNQSNDVWQEIGVEPMVDLKNLSIVSIVRPIK